jgi:hypothetical protein
VVLNNAAVTMRNTAKNMERKATWLAPPEKPELKNEAVAKMPAFNGHATIPVHRLILAAPTPISPDNEIPRMTNPKIMAPSFLIEFSITKNVINKNPA